MVDEYDELQFTIAQRSARGEERGYERVVAGARDDLSAGKRVRLSRYVAVPAIKLATAATTAAIGLWALSVLIGGGQSAQSVASSPGPGLNPSSTATSSMPDGQAAIGDTATTVFETGPCPPPPTRPENPTDADRRAFEQSVEQSKLDAASGWLPFTAKDVVNGGWYCGWTTVAPRDPSEIIAAGNRQAVYDSRGGQVVGYGYVGIGFVPIEVADAPGFDPTQLGDS